MKLHELFEEKELSVKDLFGDLPDQIGGACRFDEKKFTSLEGSPRIVGDDFFCRRNKLTSLNGGPTKVGGEFNCSYNFLTTLEGGPSEVGGDYNCIDNLLKSLKGAPVKLNESFDCSDNKELEFSLIDAPKHVGKDFFCCHTNVSSLDGMPQYIGRTLSFYNSKLTSLHNIHKHVKHIGKIAIFDYNPIKSHVLGLLLIDGLQEVRFGNHSAVMYDLEKIITKHLEGDRDIFACQEELIEAGLEDFAQL